MNLTAYVVGAERLEGTHKLKAKVVDGGEGLVEIHVPPDVYEKFSRNFPNGPFLIEMRMTFDKPTIT